MCVISLCLHHEAAQCTAVTMKTPATKIKIRKSKPKKMKTAEMELNHNKKHRTVNNTIPELGPDLERI